jgi:hypothetical protein
MKVEMVVEVYVQMILIVVVVVVVGGGGGEHWSIDCRLHFHN